MAAMFMTNNTLFSYSKSFPNVPSLTIPKPSKLFFASNHSDWRNATTYRKTRDEIVGRSNADDIKQYTNDAVDAANSLVDKAKEGANTVAKNIESVGEKAKDYAYDAKDQTTEAASYVTDTTKQGIETITKETEKVVDSTTNNLKNAGEKANEAVGEAWETAKDKAEKVKEIVAGEN